MAVSDLILSLMLPICIHKYVKLDEFIMPFGEFSNSCFLKTSDLPEGKLKLFEVGKRFNKLICGLFNMIQVMNYYVGICFLGGFRLATSILVTKWVGYNFGMLMTDFIY